MFKCVQLEAPCRQCKRPTSETLRSSTASDWGRVLRVPTKVSFLDVEIRRSAEQDSFTVHAFWCSTTFSSRTSGVLEQRVSGTRYRTRWAKSNATSFPDLSPLEFYTSGRVRNLFMVQKKNDIRDLQQGIQDGFANICRTRGVFQQFRQSLFTPVTSHFEHVL